jgi:hypothetical protein
VGARTCGVLVLVAGRAGAWSYIWRGARGSFADAGAGGASQPVSWVSGERGSWGVWLWWWSACADGVVGASVPARLHGFGRLMTVGGGKRAQPHRSSWRT